MRSSAVSYCSCATKGLFSSHLGGKGLTKEELKSVESMICPLQRLGTRMEVAEAALFLASPLSAYTTGSVLMVDGGEWLTSGQTFNSVFKSML